MKFSRLVVLGIGYSAFLMCPWLSKGIELPEMTYQGHLIDGGRSANGIYDFSVSLFGSAVDPSNQLAGPNSISSILVTNGLFHLPLVFDAQLIDGSPRWLEIGVKTNGADEFVILEPRHQLKSAPYAITAGQVIAGGLPGGIYTNALTLINRDNQFTGTFSGEGSNLTNISFGGLSDSAQGSITNIARSAAESATNGLSAEQLRGYGIAPSFSATSPTNISSFLGPVSIQATNRDRGSGNAALYVFQPDYAGPAAIHLEGALRGEFTTDRYRTVFTAGNPAMFSNGYIALDGGINTPPMHNAFMLGIFTDVPAGIELVNQFASTNAFHIEASGPAKNGVSPRYPVVFSVTSRGQMSLINPYGTSYPEPQLILTDATAPSDQDFSLRSTGGKLTIGSYDRTAREENPALSIASGNVGIGTTDPQTSLDVRGTAYLPTNSAPFSVTSGSSLIITNSNNRSQIVLQIGFSRQDNALPSCRITSTNLVSTNAYVISPLPVGDDNASITNLYTLPVQTNSVVVVEDTSASGSSISLLSYELFGH